MRSTFPKALGAFALAVCMASGVQAATLSLTDLFGGASLVAGDKQFDNFSFVFEDSNDPTRLSPVDTDNILVTTLPDGGDVPGPGLDFSILGGEFDVSGAGFYTYLDFSFSFRVSVVPTSAKGIVGASMGGVGAVIDAPVDGSNDNGTFIYEKIGTAALLDDLGNLSVEFSLLDDVLTQRLSDSTSFAAQPSLWVTKNLLVWATDQGDSASLLGFNQRFEQRALPEPASYALAALALLAAGVTGRTRRKG